jgi:membrane dipeptidase
LTFWRDPHPINHQDLLVLDSHVDIPSNFATSEVDPGQEGTAQVDLVKMSQGNLNTVFFIVYVGQLERTKENFANAREQALGKFEAIKRMTEMYPDRIALARSAGDVTRLRHEGKMVALIGVENGFAFGEDLSLVEDFYQRGMRYAGFSHFGHSNFADSSNPSSKLDDAEEEHGGLSKLLSSPHTPAFMPLILLPAISLTKPCWPSRRPAASFKLSLLTPI